MERRHVSRPRFRRIAARTGAVLGAVAIAVAVAAPADAHVKVSGTDAVQGGYGVVTFRVPSESATASTVGLKITFPSDTPFVSADLQPKAGWTGKVIMKPLATPVKDDDGDEIKQYVAEIDFTADSTATAIPPGEFDMFNISVGAFPKAASVGFPALQIYSDGTQVNWDETSANGTEPEHPTPVLALSSAAGTAAASATAPTVTATGVAAASTSSSTPWTGVVGLIAGLLALVVSLVTFGFVRSRSVSATS
jgi:uncharacterized protein